MTKKKIKVGNRKTEGKLRWRNFPMFLMEPLIQVAHEGEKKYSSFNFLKGQYVNNCLDSIKRHLTKFENPYLPDTDEEMKNVSHMACVAWNALVICYVMKFMPHLDDRYKGEK